MTTATAVPSGDHNLLVELLVEELPPKALKTLGDAFAALLADALKAQGFALADAAVTAYASPRRLAVHVAGVAAAAPPQHQSQKLMPVSVGLDVTGAPTPALLKKLAALGHAADSAVPQLRRQLDGKAEALFIDSTVPGATLAHGLQKALSTAIAKLPIPKLMQYQLADGWTSVQFVRPAHGLVALHGADVVPVSVLGLQSGRTTVGHRFEAARPAIALRHADSYPEQLRSEGAVIASFGERRAELVRQLDAAAALEGLTAIADDALRDEVTALVERPNVLLCRFEPQFLDVPQDCLILTMKANQKYFPLLDAAGRLTEKFLVVSNITPADPSRVVQGNERVVRPRLADAKFFFDQDRRTTLASRVPALAKVVYHGRLGTQGDRVERVRAIAAGIVALLGTARALPNAGLDDAESAAARTGLGVDVDRAALLAKADLLTDMVGEFPELQGTMGGIYARHDGESEAVAQAIEDHYRPRFAGDALPRFEASQAGTVVALADKLETLAGLFSIGQLPTGDKDPFALRRHALGVVRLLIERRLALAVPDLLQLAAAQFAGSAANATLLADFVFERLRTWLREDGGGGTGGSATAGEVDAVLSPRPDRLADLPARLAAVRVFASLPEAPSLAAANKRVGNILKKSATAAGVGTDARTAAVDRTLFAEPAEAALFDALGSVGAGADAAFDRGDHTASLQALAALKAPVDAFFDSVMVNTDDAALRDNRIALLSLLHAKMTALPTWRGWPETARAMHPIKLVILGRDGVLNEFRDDHVKAPEEWVPIKGALEAVARLNHAGWHAVVATNQSGVGRGMIDMAAVNAIHAQMNRALALQGGRVDAVFFCPHTPQDDCDCRKPLPGLLLDIGRRYGADLQQVPVVGDTLRDLTAARAAGCEPHLVLSGRAAQLGDDEVGELLRQVPGASAHASLAAFAEFLLRRDHIVDSASGGFA